MALLTGGPMFYSLKRLLSDLEIEFDEDVLHNAGNDAVYTMKTRADCVGFFHHFHRNHPRLPFMIGELFDGTTHVVVSVEEYVGIKDELQRKTRQSLPDVSYINDRDVTIKEERKSFPHYQSYRDFSMPLKVENDRIKASRKEEANQQVTLLGSSLKHKPDARFMAFDVETYEHDKSITLEIGYVFVNLDKPEEKEAFHYIIEENLHYTNKDYVPDNRERFKFGTSQRMSLEKTAEKFKQHIADADFLVTHAGHHDEEYLAGCGISLEGKQMFDTQALAMALLTGGPNSYSLKRLLSDLEIEFDEDILHNAGNDAVYTMKVFHALSKKI
ncbi:hypothetical protein OS493_003804 [Desmophyllum pertusum]|uniref:Gfd2/YDR514C-like C-terminal domain-containing protein n=1 Tax=Desmophyllum pertusum TaxID=174260 RepID=A0A9X0A653_9CNID|nr:hypothetical protein OS493_003804 [Desmophyllum pertusum]